MPLLGIMKLGITVLNVGLLGKIEFLRQDYCTELPSVIGVEMIVKSRAQSQLIGEVELDEQCSLCNVAIPDGAVVLRYTETNNIICVPCLGWIAMINPDDEIVDDRT